MGIYVNPGNENFLEDLNSGIYVDKSMLLSKINRYIKTNKKYVCISRPRRFGKTIAGSMIAAYYSKGCDSRQLFSSLKISSDLSYETHLNKYNVIKIDLNDFYNNKPKNSTCIDYMTSRVVKEIRKEFPSVELEAETSFANAILDVYSVTGESFIIVIDEYDVLVREKAQKEELEQYLRFLNGLFKSSSISPAIALAYLTGILPVVRDEVQSKLNNFEPSYTMLGAGELSEFAGFTEEEVKSLCLQYGMDFSECERWYNGYILNNIKVYNPKSVVSAMDSHECSSFWVRTGNYDSIASYINLNFEGIKDDVIAMIAGRRIKVNVFMYLNTMTDFRSKDDVFTYLIHLGYLAYNSQTEECYIPNNEIKNEWLMAINNNSDYKAVIDAIDASDELLQSVIAGDENAVSVAIEKAHSVVMSNLTYNKESCFQSAIILAFFTARAKYTVITELPSGKGYADVVLIPFIPDVPAIVIELKNSEKASAETALEQIRQKKYFDVLEKYSGNIILVGISYNPNTKQHFCKIEKSIK